ncbi:MAG: AAA family ATPase [Candidatus Bathyarchaeota archaeon]|nr:AAA family ATPase [Candidatus Bathyarchaeota archaeon]MDH5787290.1 AAA family ATPase [Candidatus Bathyarchaeota archaeon]
MLQKISTGCESIDNILGGGIQFGNVGLIYGEPETGKTTLAIQCAANCTRQNYKTLFIDCDGTFSARRMSQILSDDLGKAELVILMKPEDFHEQTVVVDQLPEYLTKSFGLVIVDTMTSLYRVKVAESPSRTFELNRELNRQMALSAQIARTQKIAVLVTSQVRSAFHDAQVSIEPVATRVLKFWADTIIALKPTGNSQVIKATVEKNPRKMHPQTCRLKITETGIHEYSVR